MKRRWAAAVCAVLGAVVAVSAEVIFYPDSGTGFVGKGDVQTVLGLNDRQLSQLALENGVEFTFGEGTTYTWDCYTNGRYQNYSTDGTTTHTVGSNLQFNTRTGGTRGTGMKDITGFVLTGLLPGATPVWSNGSPNTCPQDTHPTNQDSFLADAALMVNGIVIWQQ